MLKKVVVEVLVVVVVVVTAVVIKSLLLSLLLLVFNTPVDLPTEVVDPFLMYYINVQHTVSTY
jgi:hypothetical protein